MRQFQIGHKLFSGRVDSVFTDGGGQEMERQVCEISRWFNEDETAEIAYLFAAAPDLLAACEAALWLLGTDADRRDVGDLRLTSVYEVPGALRAAIAKARGTA